MIQTFTLTDGVASQIGGQVNVNVPSDLTPDDAVIAARLSFVDSYATHVVGQYVYQASSPSSRFAPVTATFAVTNTPADQGFSGRIMSGATVVSNAFVVLLDSSSGGYKFLADTAADGLGNYTLDAKPGTNHLVALKPGYVAALGASAASARVLAPGTHSTLNLELANATRKVSGRITDDNTPPVGLTKPEMPALAL